MEKASKFGFCCGGYDTLQDVTYNMDETIDDNWFVIFRDGSKEMDACNAAACPWFRKVGCITVNVETHVGSSKLDFGVWVGGQIIQ